MINVTFKFESAARSAERVHVRLAGDDAAYPQGEWLAAPNDPRCTADAIVLQHINSASWRLLDRAALNA